MRRQECKGFAGAVGIRRISVLYIPYNYEIGVNLREQMTLVRHGRYFYHTGEYREEL